MGAGSVVVVYLRDPRERIWGMLHALVPAGVTVEGIGVDSFDSWLQAIGKEADARRDLSVLFFPAGRIERILLDRGTSQAPSLADRFAARMGRPVPEVLGWTASEA
ncbi:MAG: hypothetical protein ACE5HD_04420 [Acidobacteriota bacterium]